MRISVHALDRIGCERAERRHGSRNAESEEAQIALGEYSRGDLKSCGNDKGADAVCEQVLSDYARAACAESARRRNIFGLLEHKNLRARDTRHADPIEQNEHEEYRDKVRSDRVHPAKSGLFGEILKPRFQGEREHYYQKNIRYCIENIGDSHHYYIDPAAGKSGDGAENRADYQNERRADKTDGKAYARAHHKADGKVSAELIGAADMRENLFARVYARLLCLAVFKRFEILAVLNLLLVAIRPKAGIT